jgi:hypothetical protein
LTGPRNSGRGRCERALQQRLHNNNVAAQIWWSKVRMRWKRTVGHQMLDEEGNPTSPVIDYIV